MENISLMIWSELNRVVGTAENVLIRRRRFKLVDLIGDSVFSKTSHRYSVRLISSGSQAEGLSLPGSDFDVMFAFTDISISCSDDISVSNSVIIMDTTDIKPGFVRLRCHDRLINDKLLSSALTQTNNGFALSSSIFRDNIVDMGQRISLNSIGHGPCSTFKFKDEFENDCCFCLPCKTWPGVAADWIDRNRKNNWPPLNLVTEIVHDGCLVVPIGNPNSKDHHMQWRISFSIAEKKLVHSMNHTQFLCYGLLKLYLKYVINSNPEVKDLLCSYFLKTCLFYCIEEEDVVWNKENLVDCFWTCFRRLMKWVKDEYCPNYFIKDNNMFEGKICGEKSRILLRYLSELYHEGLNSLLRLPCLLGLQISTISKQVHAEVVLPDAEREFLSDLEILHSHFSISNNGQTTHFLADYGILQTSTNNIDKAILTINYHYTVSDLVQLLYRHIVTNKTNKSSYKQKIELKSFILHNFMNSDKYTGMLLLATLFYLEGEYNKVVTIVPKILEKLTSYTFYLGPSYCSVYDKEAYIDGICGKGLTLNEKLARYILAKDYLCNITSWFYPSEITLEIDKHSYTGFYAYINPWVYSYVIMFLSYLHMNSGESMRNTLNELYITVYHGKTVQEPEARAPFAISLLERCTQLYDSWYENKKI